jgi:uncharacterized FlaG/YvyC family protein
MPDIDVNLEGVNRRKATLIPLSAGRLQNIKWASQQDGKAALKKTLAMHSAASYRKLAVAVTTEKPRLMVENINEMLGIYNVQARFFVDSRTERRVARLHEKPSNKMIRQVPTKEFLARVAQTREYIGLVFDKKV